MVKVLIPTTKERRPILNRFIRSCDDNAGVPHQIVSFENDVGYVNALKLMVENCKDDDVVVLMNDDMVFGKDWLKILIEAYVKSTRVEIAQSQEMNNPNPTDLAITPIGKAGWFKKYACWEYKHNYIDREWTDIAKARGTYLYVPESQIYHNHWSFGKSEKDATYNTQTKYFELDKDLYNERYALTDGFRNI